MRQGTGNGAVEGSLSASHIGSAFVKVYYTVCSEQPSRLPEFYKEGSTLIYGEEDSQLPLAEETYTGQQEIARKFASLELKGSRMQAFTLDCQFSETGVLLLLIGSLSHNDGASRKFVQTFHLAPQTANGYYVLNDVFRYLKQDTPTQPSPTAPPASPVPTSHTTQVSAPAVEVKPVSVQGLAAPVKPAEPQVPVAAPSQVAEKKEVERPKQQQPPPATSVPRTEVKAAPEPKAVEKKVEAEVKPKPSSWAGIVRTADTSSPSGPPQQKQTVAPPPKASAPVKSSPDTTKPAAKRPESYSLFVRNLPYSATEQQVRAAIPKGEEVKSISINSSKGFCFIDCDSLDIVKAILQSTRQTPVTIEGRTLAFEEKRPGGSGGDGRKEREKGAFRGNSARQGAPRKEEKRQ